MGSQIYPPIMPNFNSYLGGKPRCCGKMLSRLVDIPASLFLIDSIKWTMTWIILLSVVYTYFINRLSIDSDEENIVCADTGKKKQYFAHLKRLKAAQRDLEEKRRKIAETDSFRLLDLPPEISSAVLAHCADWPSAYLAFVQASKQCQWLAFHACLPRMPIRLITTEQLRSFDALLRSKTKLAVLVQNMWITPLKEEQLGMAVAIAKRCTNLRSLASNAYIIQKAVTFRGTRLSHVDCKDLTMLSTRTEAWTTLLATPNGAAFFRQVTHLRLIGDRIPTNIPLPRLTRLSYGSSGQDASESDASIGLSMLDDRDTYPSLQTVVFTRSRAIAGGLRISRPVAKKKLFSFELPPIHTELEIWCDNARRSGIWVLCADPSIRNRGAGRAQ